MQTGSSGCQFSWLTIFLLVALVLCYQQQQQNLAISTTTDGATKFVGVEMAVRIMDGGSAVGKTDRSTTTTIINSNATGSDIAETTTRKDADTRLLFATEIINYTKLPATITATTTNNNNNRNRATNASSAVTNLYESYGIEQKLMSNEMRSNNSKYTAKYAKVATTKATTTTKNSITKNTTTTESLVPTKVTTLTAVTANKSNNLTNILKTTIKTAITNTTTTTNASYCHTTNKPTRSAAACSHIMADMAVVAAVKIQVSQSRLYSGKSGNDGNKNNKKCSAITTKCTHFYDNNKNKNTNIPPINADNDDDCDCQHRAATRGNNSGKNNSNSYNCHSMRDSKRFSIR